MTLRSPISLLIYLTLLLSQLAWSGKPGTTFDSLAAVSPSGKIAVTRADGSEELVVWESKTGRVLKTIQAPRTGSYHFLDREDRLLWVRSSPEEGHRLIEWDLEAGKQTRELLRLPQRIRVLSSHQGKLVLLIGADYSDKTRPEHHERVFVLDHGTGQFLGGVTSDITRRGPVLQADLLDGDRVIYFTQNDHTIKIADFKTASVQKEFSQLGIHRPKGYVLLKDRKSLLALTNGALIRADLATDTEAAWEADLSEIREPSEAKLSPDGTLLALALHSKVAILDAKTGALRTILPQPDVLQGAPIAFLSEQEMLRLGDPPAVLDTSRKLSLDPPPFQPASGYGNVLSRLDSVGLLLPQPAVNHLPGEKLAFASTYDGSLSLGAPEDSSFRAKLSQACATEGNQLRLLLESGRETTARCTVADAAIRLDPKSFPEARRQIDMMLVSLEPFPKPGHKLRPMSPKEIQEIARLRAKYVAAPAPLTPKQALLAEAPDGRKLALFTLVEEAWEADVEAGTHYLHMASYAGPREAMKELAAFSTLDGKLRVAPDLNGDGLPELMVLHQSGNQIWQLVPGRKELLRHYRGH